MATPLPSSRRNPVVMIEVNTSGTGDTFSFSTSTLAISPPICHHLHRYRAESDIQISEQGHDTSDPIASSSLATIHSLIAPENSCDCANAHIISQMKSTSSYATPQGCDRYPIDHGYTAAPTVSAARQRHSTLATRDRSAARTLPVVLLAAASVQEQENKTCHRRIPYAAS